MNIFSQLLPSLLVLFLSSSQVVMGGRCRNPVTRKEIRELSPKELSDYLLAVNKLHKERKRGRLSSYEEYARIHLDNSFYSHGKPAFLPWHRHYIRLYEKDLQRMVPGVVLPFWDWSVDHLAPHRSPVLSKRYVGGTIGRDNCIRDGPFGNWYMSFPRPHCLRRDYDNGNSISPFSSPESIELTLNERKFSKFSLDFEIKHGRPHTNIGGRRGDLTPHYSPNDPIFFLHHAFVDLVWSEWQDRNRGANPYDGEQYGEEASLSDTLRPFGNVTVKDTLDTEDEFFCYNYPKYPRPILGPKLPTQLQSAALSIWGSSPFAQAGQLSRDDTKSALFRLPGIIKRLRARREKYLSGNRTDIYRLFPRMQPPSALSNEFIEMMNLDPVAVTQSEAQEYELVKKLNMIPNFRSLGAIQSVINEYF